MRVYINYLKLMAWYVHAAITYSECNYLRLTVLLVVMDSKSNHGQGIRKLMLQLAAII